MFGQEKTIDFQVVATTMMGVVSETMNTMSTEKFSDTPSASAKYIYVNDHNRMLAKGSDKGYFGGCHIAVINFFRTDRDLEKNIKACGAVVVYFRNDCLVKLFKAMGFPIESEKDVGMLRDICGEFCNIVAGSFKNELVRLGFINLPMSAPQIYLDNVDSGVAFSEGETKYHELSFYFWNVKALVVDVTLAPIPADKKLGEK